MKHGRQGSWMVTVPLAGLAAAYLFLWFLPRQERLAAVSRELSDRRDYVMQSAGVVSAVAAGRQTLDETTTYVTAWQADTPDTSRLSALFTRINELADQSGLTTTRFEPLPALENETVRRVPVTYGCTGSLPQFFSFLHELESLPAGIWQESLKIEVNQEVPGELVCEVVLVIFSEKTEESDQAAVAGQPI
jgi:Tfp pilus assembly protein PilO